MEEYAMKENEYFASLFQNQKKSFVISICISA